MVKRTNKRTNNRKNTKRKILKSGLKCKIFKENFSGELYYYFMHLKLNPNHNIINFTSKSYKNHINFTFNSFKYDNYKSDPKWNDIKCSELKLKNDLLIKSECISMQTNKKDPESLSFYKVFVKGIINLYDYIQCLQKKKISKKTHELLFDYLIKSKDYLEKRFNKKINLINHNMDVKTLHFKFI